MNDIYFYIEDGDRRSVVALFKRDGVWKEGRIVKGIRPKDWPDKEREYISAFDVEEQLEKRYDYAEFIEGDYKNYLRFCD